LAETRAEQVMLNAQTAHDIAMQRAAVRQAMIHIMQPQPDSQAPNAACDHVLLGYQAALAYTNSARYLSNYSTQQRYYEAAIPILTQQLDHFSRAERLTNLCQQVLQAAGPQLPGMTMADMSLNQLHAALQPLRHAPSEQATSDTAVDARRAQVTTASISVQTMCCVELTATLTQTDRTPSTVAQTQTEEAPLIGKLLPLSPPFSCLTASCTCSWQPLCHNPFRHNPKRAVTTAVCQVLCEATLYAIHCSKASVQWPKQWWTETAAQPPLGH
jgi:hypothetical protein